MDGMFHITLMIGRRLYWEVDANGLLEIPDASSARAGLISFDSHDHRVRCARAQSERQGRQRFMRDWGESVRIVNLSRELGAQYGRDPAHGPSRPAHCPLFSGLQLMDCLARQSGRDTVDCILGLHFGASEAHGRSLLMLFAYDAQGELLLFQEAANPPSLHYFREDFLRGLPPQFQQLEVIWYGHQAVLAALPALRPYPDEETFAGRPVREWWSRAARLSTALGAMASLLACALAWQAWRADVERGAESAMAAQLRASLQDQLRSHPLALARLGSAQPSVAFVDAEALWQPDSQIRLVARPGRIEYAVVLSRANGSAVRTTSGVRNETTSLDSALHLRSARSVPPGLAPLEPAISGDLHALLLRFQRQTPLSPLLAMAGAQSWRSGPGPSQP